MKTTYIYDHYYRYQEITDILTDYAFKYPGYCQLSAIGETAEGRKLWMLELTDLSKGDFADKPAFALDGNVHAGEVTGSMCCMYFLDYLLTNRDEKEVAWLLAHFTVYCVPRISPDGSEAYLTSPVQLRSSNQMFPFEELRSGVQPEDLDGDGVIRQMRVKCKNGAFKICEEDPRLMVRRKPDDAEGEFYNVYSEGRILDYDRLEEVNPAPEKYGNDFNRNFPGWWGVGGRGGAYALSCAETRAFADFLYAHKNICTCLNFHTTGGVYIYPPAFESGKKAAPEDMQRYREFGEIIKEETGYEFLNLHDEFLGPMVAPVGGSIDDYCHFVLGIAACTCECWNLDYRSGVPRKFGRTTPVTQEETTRLNLARLKWLEENNGGEGFSDWKPFCHPQLGEIEIGGFDYKGVIQNPPPRFLLQEVEKHTRVMLREMKLLPRLVFDDAIVMRISEDVWKIDTVIHNMGYLPTSATKEAVTLKTTPPLEAKLCGAEIITGKASEEIGHLEGFSGIRVGYTVIGPAVVEHAPASRHLSWVVKAAAGTTIQITVASPRAGVASQEVILTQSR